jgi:UPF0716 protein FxsA
MPLILLLALFAEVAILIKLGQAIGGGYLLLELLLSAVLGLLAMRLARRAFVRTSEFVALLNSPGRVFRASGLAVVMGGVLLILPGVLTDLLGIFLVARSLLSRIQQPPRGPMDSERETIDVEYRIHDDSDA